MTGLSNAVFAETMTAHFYLRSPAVVATGKVSQPVGQRGTVIENKSCLDLAIVNQDLYKYVVTMEIDSKRLATPFKVCKDLSRKYTDHFACVVCFKGIPLKCKTVSLGNKTYNLEH